MITFVESGYSTRYLGKIPAVLTVWRAAIQRDNWVKFYKIIGK